MTAAQPAPTPAAPSLPPARTVLRRALLVWGLGHLAIGDRRGWLLVALHVAAIVGFVVLAAVLIQGSRWIILLPLLLLLLVAWVWQAVDAHRAAITRGGEPGGELGIVGLLPLVVTAVTAFWLFGGAHSTPEATLGEYVEAWRWSRPSVAASLFREPIAAQTLTGSWAERSGDRAVFAVQITRRQRIETTIFGLLPTATQQTVVVEEVGRIEVRAHDALRDGSLPVAALGTKLWLIEDVQMPLGRRIGASP